MIVNPVFPANYLDGTTLRDTLKETLGQQSGPIHETVRKWAAEGIDQIYLVGCGGSKAIMEPLKWLLDRYTQVSVDIYTAWEFVHRAPKRLNSRTAVFLASHSGTTDEVLLALDLCKERGAKTLSVSLGDTPLAQQADAALVYKTPAIGPVKQLISFMLAAEIVAQFGDRAEGERLQKALATMPEVLHHVKEATHERGKALAAQYKDAKGFYVMGHGPLEGLAYQFSICILMEMQWIHSADIQAGEFRHGPYEIVEEGTKIIHLLGTDSSRHVGERALAFAERYGADNIVYDAKEFPAVDPDLTPLALLIALQQFAWALSVERSHPLSTRRYMWKVPY